VYVCVLSVSWLIPAAGGLGPIISLLNRPDSSLVRRCLIALYFIGADKDGLQQAIGAAGALPQLLLLARSDSPDVQAEATDVLKVLCRCVAAHTEVSNTTAAHPISRPQCLDIQRLALPVAIVCCTALGICISPQHTDSVCQAASIWCACWAVGSLANLDDPCCLLLQECLMWPHVGGSQRH